MKKIIFIFFYFGFIGHLMASTKGGAVKNFKVTIKIGKQVATAIIYDNPTAKDFMALLPLKLKLKDYASTEKVSDLPKKLSTKDAPSGSDPEIGDIAYYAPWGNLAIYYKDFSYSEGLIKLGRIESGKELFNISGSFEAEITKAE